MKLLNLSPLLFTFVTAEDPGRCDKFTGAEYQQCIRARSSGSQFSGWIGPISYDGVELVAIGADVGTFTEVLPEATLGCTVYQPAKGWGYSDWQHICRLVNSVGQINTDCDFFDPDSNGGLCDNYQMILSYENWGVGESSGPDIWAHSSTWTENTASQCNSYYQPRLSCTFPSDEQSYTDCKAVAHTWSVMVYACEDFSSSQKTTPPSTIITCPAQSATPSVCNNLVDLIYTNLGKSRNSWDSYMGHGCNCPALAGNSNFGGNILDTIDGHCDSWIQCASSGSGEYTLEFDGTNYVCTSGDISKCECDMAAVDAISSAAVTSPVQTTKGDCQAAAEYTFLTSLPNELVGQCSTFDTTGLIDYGCWCQVADGGAPLRGKPLDELDNMCSRLSKCIKCNGACDLDYSATVTGTCNDIVCSSTSNSYCQEANCECIKSFAIDLDYYLSINTIDASLTNVDPALCVRAYPPVAGSC